MQPASIIARRLSFAGIARLAQCRCFTGHRLEGAAQSHYTRIALSCSSTHYGKHFTTSIHGSGDSDGGTRRSTMVVRPLLDCLLQPPECLSERHARHSVLTSVVRVAFYSGSNQLYLSFGLCDAKSAKGVEKWTRGSMINLHPPPLPFQVVAV